MVPRQNKNNADAKLGGTNKECFDIFQNGLIVNVIYSSAKKRFDEKKKEEPN